MATQPLWPRLGLLAWLLVSGLLAFQAGLVLGETLAGGSQRLLRISFDKLAEYEEQDYKDALGLISLQHPENWQDLVETAENARRFAEKCDALGKAHLRQLTSPDGWGWAKEGSRARTVTSRLQALWDIGCLQNLVEFEGLKAKHFRKISGFDLSLMTKWCWIPYPVLSELLRPPSPSNHMVLHRPVRLSLESLKSNPDVLVTLFEATEEFPIWQVLDTRMMRVAFKGDLADTLNALTERLQYIATVEQQLTEAQRALLAIRVQFLVGLWARKMWLALDEDDDDEVDDELADNLIKTLGEIMRALHGASPQPNSTIRRLTTAFGSVTMAAINEGRRRHGASTADLDFRQVLVRDDEAGQLGEDEGVPPAEELVVGLDDILALEGFQELAGNFGRDIILGDFLAITMPPTVEILAHRELLNPLFGMEARELEAYFDSHEPSSEDDDEGYATAAGTGRAADAALRRFRERFQPPTAAIALAAQSCDQQWVRRISEIMDGYPRLRLCILKAWARQQDMIPFLLSTIKSGTELCLVAGRTFTPMNNSPSLVVSYVATKEGGGVTFDTQASAQELAKQPDRMLDERSFIVDEGGTFIDASGPKWTWIELMAKMMFKQLFVPGDKQIGYKPVLGISAQMGPSLVGTILAMMLQNGLSSPATLDPGFARLILMAEVEEARIKEYFASAYYVEWDNFKRFQLGLASEHWSAEELSLPDPDRLQYLTWSRRATKSLFDEQNAYLPDEQTDRYTRETLLSQYLPTLQAEIEEEFVRFVKGVRGQLEKVISLEIVAQAPQALADVLFAAPQYTPEAILGATNIYVAPEVKEHSSISPRLLFEAFLQALWEHDGGRDGLLRALLQRWTGAGCVLLDRHSLSLNFNRVDPQGHAVSFTPLLEAFVRDWQQGAVQAGAVPIPDVKGFMTRVVKALEERLGYSLALEAPRQGFLATSQSCYNILNVPVAGDLAAGIRSIIFALVLFINSSEGAFSDHR